MSSSADFSETFFVSSNRFYMGSEICFWNQSPGSVLLRNVDKMRHKRDVYLYYKTQIVWKNMP